MTAIFCSGRKSVVTRERCILKNSFLQIFFSLKRRGSLLIDQCPPNSFDCAPIRILKHSTVNIFIYKLQMCISVLIYYVPYKRGAEQEIKKNIIGKHFLYELSCSISCSTQPQTLAWMLTSGSKQLTCIAFTKG